MADVYHCIQSMQMNVYALVVYSTVLVANATVSETQFCQINVG